MSKYINIDDLKKKKRFDFAKQRHNVRMTDIYNAPSIEIVRCAECVYCNIQNTKYLYAICERHSIEFKPFEDDTRTHYCAWGVKADRKTEPTHDLRTETHECVKDTHDKTEPQICDTCRYYNDYIPCGSTPSACKEADRFAKEFAVALMKLKPQTERGGE